MRLAADEQAMLDGNEGPGRQEAIDLPFRYGEALGAVVTHAPAMTDFDRDPLEVIETGDWVKVDADEEAAAPKCFSLASLGTCLRPLKTGIRSWTTSPT